MKGLEAYEIVKEECGFAFGETANGDRVRANLPIIEKELKALEIIKGINFDIVYREQFDEWTLFIVIETQDGKDLEPIAFGSGKKQYDLLKEVGL